MKRSSYILKEKKQLLSLRHFICISVVLKVVLAPAPSASPGIVRNEKCKFLDLISELLK